MKPLRWLQRLLHLPTRPLQIPEVLEAAAEHMRAVAVEGLARRYLPVRLSVAVSSADFQALEPFTAELQRELREVRARLAEKPRYVALPPPLEIDLIAAEDLAQGSAPRFHATFPAAERRASWRPPAGRSTATPALGERGTAQTGASAPGPLFEVVVTSVAKERTGLQSVYVLCLEPALPARCLDPEAAASLAVAADGRVVDAASGEPWPGTPPETFDLGAALPVELDADGDVAAAARSAKLYRFYRPGRPEVLWAPQGFLMVGRRAELVHWVPAAAPPNLSGRHFALFRAGGRALAVADLDSTNGTYLGGRRLQPFERVPVEPAATLEVGTEATLRLDLRWLDDE